LILDYQLKVIFNIFFPYTQNIVFSSASNSNDHNDNNYKSLECQSNDSELNKKPFNKFEKFYSDPVNQRNKIRSENNGKIGVYAWVNKINNKVYVGSGNPLYTRLSDYYQSWYLSSRTNLYVIKAFNKYTMANFSLYILEYTNSESLIACEQNWINLIDPEYNTNPTAGSTKGYKHTDQALEKMRKLSLGRTHTEEVKNLMSENRKGINNPFYGKTHSAETIEKFKNIASTRENPPVEGLEVEITDLETKTTFVYDSIRKAAISINSDIKTILRREKSQREKGINTPYRNRYLISIKRD